MNIKKQISILSLISLLLFTNFMSFASEYDVKSSDLIAETAVLINEQSGQVLFDKNADTPMFPASTTKILTAIIILEDLPLDEIVTVDANSPFAGGSSIALEPNEQLTIEQLLYALIITSANDAAEALAIHHSGSIEAFADVMNKRAAKLGAVNSNFENPHGLPNPDHVTTAYDLAMIAKHAMENDMFRKLVTTVRYEIPPTNLKKDTRYLNSTNSFYQGMEGSNDLITVRGKKIPIAYEYVVGIKRGYTEQAMNCLVTSAEKDGKSYISVVLKSNGNSMYQDSRLLLDYGLYGLATHVLNKKNDTIETVQLNNKRETKIPLIVETDVIVDLLEDIDPASLSSKVTINSNIDLPVSKGEVLGTLAYYNGEQLLTSVPLVSLDDFAGEDLVTELTNFFVTDQRPIFSKSWFIYLFIRLIIALLLWRSVMTLIRLQGLKRKQKSKQKTKLA
ncbi:D-alanyl-D-alanine carboxypeptidase family protein [Fusibacter bizertensis]|uniref:serine-type D-Ala-D-Ala carboxypeptidase n=1 Tax=Fusibacter bizertensis TaxID=1488331 RepID=A0ABT6ND84_9FIRM|nr:D-alanyl-D-alanine carboxypeptidase family protein [Fusibacter bizertensis]MDH8678376.1 D-alanyl-D-alanine carboxypeptidase family protein [Fusibacter bizertensis]